VARPPGVVAPPTGSGEGAEPSPATPVQPACLTQRRDNDDPEVGDRAPERGESWIPPLGPEREGSPLEVPAFDDATEDAEDAGDVVQAATPDAGPALDEAAALVDELGSYDEAEAFIASATM